MFFPERLFLGDTVGLVAPASPIYMDKVRECEEKLIKIGFKTKIGKCLSKGYCHRGYLAGPARDRADDINDMFADPEVKAVFCTRGGYGSSEIMPYLDYEMIKKNPKIFIGYSDITNLLTAFTQLCHFVTFHGPMVYSNMLEHFDTYTKESLWSAVNLKPGDKLNFKNPPAESGKAVLYHGHVQGRLIGGNLSVLSKGIGSFYEINAEGKVLFLEDIGESLARIDMMLTQLEHARVLEGVKGIILGDFAGCTNSKYDNTYRLVDLFREKFKKYNIPVIYNVRSGHNHPMSTLPIGCVCTMDTFQNSLVFHHEE